MTRRTTFFRALALLAAFLSVASATDALAHCCMATVRMADDICPVTFCIVTNEGRICQTYAPGTITDVDIPCGSPITVAIVDGCGTIRTVTPENCIDNVIISHTCCVKICIRINPDTNCPVISVSRATGPCSCPPAP